MLPDPPTGPTRDAEQLKGQVRDFWNRQSCDTHIAGAEKFTREYFEEIESFRYTDQPLGWFHCIRARKHP